MPSSCCDPSSEAFPGHGACDPCVRIRRIHERTACCLRRSSRRGVSTATSTPALIPLARVPSMAGAPSLRPPPHGSFTITLRSRASARPRSRARRHRDSVVLSRDQHCRDETRHYHQDQQLLSVPIEMRSGTRRIRSDCGLAHTAEQDTNGSPRYTDRKAHPRSRGSSGGETWICSKITHPHEGEELLHPESGLGTALRDQASCLGARRVALEGSPRVEWCSTSASIWRWFLRCRCRCGLCHDSVGQLRECCCSYRRPVRHIRHRQRRRHPPAASPRLCRRSQQRLRP